MKFRKLTSGENVNDILHEVARGCNIFCLTKGQISLIELISGLIDRVGVVEMLISMWTIGMNEVAILHRLFLKRRISNIRFIVDRSFRTRRAQPFRNLVECFGGDTIRILTNHSKIVLLRGNGWNITLRGSMNLNRNLRAEHIDITDDEGLFLFIWDIFGELFETQENDEAFVAGFKHNNQLAIWALDHEKHHRNQLI